MTNVNQTDFEKIFDTARIKTIRENPFEIKSLDKKANGEPLEIIAENISLKEIMILRQFKLIQELDKKLLNGRVKDKETEKIRIQYYKLYLTAVNTFMKLTKDYDTSFDKEIIKKFILSDIHKTE